MQARQIHAGCGTHRPNVATANHLGDNGKRNLVPTHHSHRNASRWVDPRVYFCSAQPDHSTRNGSAVSSAAAQRRSGAEITQLRDAQTGLLAAATAVQSYVWYVDKDVRLRTKIDVEDWHATREFVEPAVVSAQRLRAIARAMPSDELRDAYIAVERLIMKVIKGSDDPNAPDAWHEDVTGPQPDRITRAVNATADAIKRLYNLSNRAWG